jgi:hypothetical protein
MNGSSGTSSSEIYIPYLSIRGSFFMKQEMIVDNGTDMYVRHYYTNTQWTINSLHQLQL